MIQSHGATEYSTLSQSRSQVYPLTQESDSHHVEHMQLTPASNAIQLAYLDSNIYTWLCSMQLDTQHIHSAIPVFTGEIFA